MVLRTRHVAKEYPSVPAQAIPTILIPREAYDHAVRDP